MENTRASNRNLETYAWAAFFIWWGITELGKSLPPGIAVIGFGLILIGLNVARLMNGNLTSGFTITLGILALVLGGLELAGFFLNLSFELPVFAILLIVLGVIVLARALIRNRNQ